MYIAYTAGGRLTSRLANGRKHPYHTYTHARVLVALLNFHREFRECDGGVADILAFHRARRFFYIPVRLRYAGVCARGGHLSTRFCRVHTPPLDSLSKSCRPAARGVCIEWMQPTVAIPYFIAVISWWGGAVSLSPDCLLPHNTRAGRTRSRGLSRMATSIPQVGLEARLRLSLTCSVHGFMLLYGCVCNRRVRKSSPEKETRKGLRSCSRVRQQLYLARRNTTSMLQSNSHPSFSVF